MVLGLEKIKCLFFVIALYQGIFSHKFDYINFKKIYQKIKIKIKNIITYEKKFKGTWGRIS